MSKPPSVPNHHTVHLVILSGLGVFHFACASAGWVLFYIQWCEPIGLSAGELLRLFAGSISICVLLLTGFTVSLIVAVRKVRGRDLLFISTVFTTCLAFLWDVRNPQIHFFHDMTGKMWANNLYVTWPSYSWGPYICPTTRYIAAATIFAGTTAMVVISKRFDELTHCAANVAPHNGGAT